MVPFDRFRVNYKLTAKAQDRLYERGRTPPHRILREVYPERSVRAQNDNAVT
jgi:hypothetical protein